MIEIRKAKKSDFEQYRKLYKEFWQEYQKIVVIKSKESLTEYIRKDFQNKLRNYFLVVAKDKKLIGYFEGNIYKNPNRAYIADMFIKKEYRNKGLATELRNLFYVEVKKNKIKHIELDVNVKNKAYELYKKWGFETRIYKMHKVLK